VQANRPKDLEKLVAELLVDKAMLEEIAKQNW